MNSNKKRLLWVLTMTLFGCGACESDFRYKKKLTGQLYIVANDAFPSKTLVQMDEGDYYHAVAGDIFELRGNDSLLLLVDTADNSTNYLKLRIKGEVYEEDLEHLTSLQYDSLSRSVKIDYVYP
jgi:hypothetical protein